MRWLLLLVGALYHYFIQVPLFVEMAEIFRYEPDMLVVHLVSAAIVLAIVFYPYHLHDKQGATFDASTRKHLTDYGEKGSGKRTFHTDLDGEIMEGHDAPTRDQEQL